jgi:hypothetical protein
MYRIEKKRKMKNTYMGVGVKAVPLVLRALCCGENV